eukprot:scaffold22247_cov66-Skeletonema_marinoi.AAC.1
MTLPTRLFKSASDAVLIRGRGPSESLATSSWKSSEILAARPELSPFLNSSSSMLSFSANGGR